MPRLPKTMADKQDESIMAHIDAYKCAKLRRGWSIDNVAKALGLSCTTLHRRSKDPGSFTLKQLRDVANTLNVSMSTLLGEKGNT